MILTFFASMGVGVFLGIRMCQAYSRGSAQICQQIDSALNEPRSVEEILAEIDRLNGDDFEDYPRGTIIEHGRFTL